MSKIFLSYRRDDTGGHAGRLHQELVKRFGGERVFLDIELEPGLDFEEGITTALASCSVFIVLIGRQFLTLVDSEGRRRIDKSDDHLRAEIAEALSKNIRLIPVQVEGAEMPQ